MDIHLNRYLAQPGTKISLKDFDPSDKQGFEEGKSASLEVMDDLRLQVGEIQERLYAGQKGKILIILQGLDTSGKDGLIRSVFKEVDPQGVRVESFKVPSPVELAHDYLWRVHKVVPGKGDLVIFNRSHYEDVLVVRVRKLAPKSVWEKRYRHIVEFERMLVDEGTLILKFFLYIDQEEQRERLLARLTEPDKHWKFNPGDLDDRALWPEYIKAYEEMLSRTSTKYAPWWIIPANRKWYRDLVAANILIREAQKLHLEYPEAAEGLDQYIKLLQQVED